MLSNSIAQVKQVAYYDILRPTTDDPGVIIMVMLCKSFIYVGNHKREEHNSKSVNNFSRKIQGLLKPPSYQMVNPGKSYKRP